MSCFDKKYLIMLLTIIAIGGICIADIPGTMNYQGYLCNASGDPINDTLAIGFHIYDSANGGNHLWGESTGEVIFDSGYFSATLGLVQTIPDSIFLSSNTWLELVIEGETLSPRTSLAKVPYASSVGSIEGAYAGKLMGNLETSGNIKSGNSIIIDGDNDKITATGGLIDFDDENLITTGKVSIGLNCTNPGGSAFVAGNTNAANGTYSSVSGGLRNIVDSLYSVIGGGYRNRASYRAATVCGGDSNVARAQYSFIGGGVENTVTGTSSTIGGGSSNYTEDVFSTIGGGAYNNCSGRSSIIAGGESNNVSDDYSAITGGFGNSVTSEVSAICGGRSNSVSGNYSVIGGGGGTPGQGNTITANFSFIGGGQTNTIVDDPDWPYEDNIAIVAGSHNYANGRGAFIGGGWGHKVEAEFASVLGGYADTITADADYSYLFGKGSKLTTSSTFMVDMPHIRFGNETNGYEFPVIDGAAGQAMVTDGNGTLSWATISGGGTFWKWSDSSSHGADSVYYADVADNAQYSDSTGAITDGAVDLADIGQNGATEDQVITYNGSQWVARDNVGQTGFFPSPMYDSQWFRPHEVGDTLYHNLGIDPVNMLVDLIYWDTDDIYGINNKYFGGAIDGYADKGAYYANLTQNFVVVYRFNSDGQADSARVRIWVIADN